MPWLTIPDGNVTVSNSGSGTLAHSGGVFTATNAYANLGAADDVFSAPGGPPNYFTINLPSGYEYTGNTRLTITTSTMSNDAYDQIVFTQVSSPQFSGNPVPAGEYLEDIGPLVPSTNVYCVAGIDNGSGGAGVYAFTLEFEYTESAPAAFWTDFRGCEEQL